MDKKYKHSILHFEHWNDATNSLSGSNKVAFAPQQKKGDQSPKLFPRDKVIFLEIELRFRQF